MLKLEILIRCEAVAMVEYLLDIADKLMLCVRAAPKNTMFQIEGGKYHALCGGLGI